MTAEWAKTAKCAPKSPSRRRGGADLAIAEIAARQHGIVTLGQLNDVGLGGRAVSSRVAGGRLHRVHTGVYSVGHPLLSPEGRWMAAVLACGPGAVLSHRSAAALWGIRRSPSPRIEVTAPLRRRRRRPELTIHSGSLLTEADRSEISGISITSLARTLLDLAGVLDADRVRRACREAEVLRLFDLRTIDELLRRSVGRRGVRRLRAVIDDLREPDLTRSDLEERFLGLCRRAGLPRPRVNLTVPTSGEPFEVDFSWLESRLIVELDGRAYHGTASAFESDRRRDQLLAAEGWRVIRATWRQVVHEPESLAATVRTLLTA